ncbi:probable inactive receptor kinase At5g67200 isoform X2 [Amaranthus tricolor]|uniref:probable inactive receptor kinase At5g67200 isoform X2 n=1 Tax=Amaranthus tricolor TaxID=29722 RepID=UPI0025841C67|nr:probable inactive receptor kinase At5g67200 isoform X2 [Amaranthus tricolor]
MPHLTLFLFFFVSISNITHSHSQPQPQHPNDAASLLSFKSKADLDNKLLFTLHEHFDYCQWQGVKCQQARVIRFALPNYSLRGTFPPNTLTLLDQLRVLVLRNNSLFGPLPSDLHTLSNLRSLILDNNFFTGSLPPSIFTLYKLRVLQISFNNFSGSLSPQFLNLDRLTTLKLQFNGFNGGLPAFNQTALVFFNVSGNNFSGKIPDTPTLSQFPRSSFALNPNLCGELINLPCDSQSPFFDSSSATNQPSSTTPESSPSSDQSAAILSPPSNNSRHKRKIIILGFSLGGLLLVSSLLFMILAAKKRTTTQTTTATMANGSKTRDYIQSATSTSGPISEPEVIRVRLDSQSNELKDKCKEIVEGVGGMRREKSGNLVFCGAEVKLYTLEQLMRASAEMLGRGNMGTTYKAKLDNQLIVTVKRLDAIKMSGVNGEMFEKLMESIGGLRHPNLVPIRAYFQAREERLIIYDYQPNGSRSTRAKPLHWTSCLKIAEDVAQGLAYIHQASKLIHGNLKACNVLLGTDFEACVTDYCLATLSAAYADNEDPDSARYRGPEARNSSWKPTPKTDVYAFGVLLLELLSSKLPSQHPFLAPHDMLDWVKAMRGDDDNFEDNHLAMLVEVSGLCSLTSPEQRPPMWQVLKMIQKIKASVGSDDAVNPTTTGYS